MTNAKETTRLIHPRLRVLQNGAKPVNTSRAIFSPTVATSLTPSQLASTLPSTAELMSYAHDVSVQSLQAPPRHRVKKAAKLADQTKADNSYVNVLVEIERDRSANSGSRQSSTIARIAALAESAERRITKTDKRRMGSRVLVRRNFVSATIPIAALAKLQDMPGIAYIHRSEPLTFARPKAQHALSTKPQSRAVSDQASHALHGDGADIIIGIIDVGGFDFAHEDFADGNGGTRFSVIWDQGGDFRSPPGSRGRNKFDYGSELTQTMMNAAMQAQAAGGLPAVMLERQSQMSEASHATHVTSIAAGNQGLCPKAEIAGVLISIPNEGAPLEVRRTTFSDSTRIIHAVEYLLEYAERKNKPIAINISLGTNGGPHDGCSGVNRWLDALLSSPGRAIALAAGNAGQERGVDEDDMGYVMGRIHASGQVPARGLNVDIEWNVVGGRIEDFSENELEIWYGAQDRITVMLKPPGAQEWLKVSPGEFIENRLLPSGTRVSMYNELYHPTNGANYTAIYLTPNYQRNSLRGVAGGIWRVRLVGDEIRDGNFHCWIERDDVFELQPGETTRRFYFPSFFSESSNTDSHSISSLACGHRVIAVANLDEAKQVMNISSSQGPTRDGRTKPDIAAPGTDIIAAKGFTQDDDHWVGMTGTSMASPYVTGVMGLMLATNPGLTAAQCMGILQRTAQPLPGATYDWRNDAGFGQIAPALAVQEASTFNRRTEV